MAEHNAIEQGRWDKALRSIFSMSQGSVAPVLAPEIVPQIIIQNFEPQHFLYRGEFLYAGMAAVAAGGAGTFGAVQLINTDPGCLVVVESISFFSSAAIVEVRHLENTIAGGVESTDVSPRDTRATVALRRAGRIFEATPAAQVGSVTLARLDGQTPGYIPLPIVLHSDSITQRSIVVQTDAGNAAFFASFQWREVPVPEGEGDTQ